MAVLPGGDRCVCTEVVRNNLYVAVNDYGSSHVYSYNIDKNLWEKLPPPLGSINSLCKISDFLYAVSSDCNTRRGIALLSVNGKVLQEYVQ